MDFHHRLLEAVARRRRFFWWASSVAALIALAVLATQLARERIPFPSGWFVPLGLAFVALVALFILWKVPHWQVRHVEGLDPKERFDRANEARKTLATILGGIALLASFYSTTQNLRVAEEGQITDRFTKAIEQLGAVYPDGKLKVDVRVGGVYALARIANDSEKDFRPIMEVFCTYVRELRTTSDTADVQAIMTIITRENRKYKEQGQHLDLSYATLGLLYLDGSDLSRANLTATSFWKAHLARANLIGADFNGASLSSADLSGADLSEANLHGAHLDGADLSEVKGLNQKQIDDALGDSTTKLPSNVHIPESWKK